MKNRQLYSHYYLPLRDLNLLPEEQSEHEAELPVVPAPPVAAFVARLSREQYARVQPPWLVQIDHVIKLAETYEVSQCITILITRYDILLLLNLVLLLLLLLLLLGRKESHDLVG